MIKLVSILKEAKQVGVLYHYTYLKNLISILKTNTLKLSSNHETISFTRDKLAYKNIASIYSCRLVIDGDKLSENYKLKPIQYSYTKKDEMETEGYKDIKNIIRYIIRIDFFEKPLGDEMSDYEVLDFKKILGINEEIPSGIISLLRKKYPSIEMNLYD